MSFAEPAIGCQLSPFMLVSINVPLEPPDQQYCQAAVGYVELGMFQDANDQLEKIDPFNRAAPEVLAVRLAIYRGLKKWELMQQIAKRLKSSSLIMSNGQSRWHTRPGEHIPLT